MTQQRLQPAAPETVRQSSPSTKKKGCVGTSESSIPTPRDGNSTIRVTVGCSRFSKLLSEFSHILCVDFSSVETQEQTLSRCVPQSSDRAIQHTALSGIVRFDANSRSADLKPEVMLFLSQHGTLFACLLEPDQTPTATI